MTSGKTLAIAFVLTTLLGILVGNHEPVCECMHSPTPVDSEKIIERGVIIIGFKPDQEKQIREELGRLTTKQCIEAFEYAGLINPIRRIQETGVILRPSKDLNELSIIELGITDERLRVAYVMEFSSCRVQAATISPILFGIRRTVDGRPRIFLHPTAFVGESWWLNTYSLHDVLVHEFIHAGGQPPTPRWPWETDLAGFEYYDDIMNACK